jgi:hypothetical protein
LTCPEFMKRHSPDLPSSDSSPRIYLELLAHKSADVFTAYAPTY